MAHNFSQNDIVGTLFCGDRSACLNRCPCQSIQCLSQAQCHSARTSYGNIETFATCKKLLLIIKWLQTIDDYRCSFRPEVRKAVLEPGSCQSIGKEDLLRGSSVSFPTLLANRAAQVHARAISCFTILFVTSLSNTCRANEFNS